ncbi:MAG: tRNA (guanine(37)-N(1))-methyltransferase [Candidatus Kapaibacterium sp.]|nr:MAG: tRNA (guanine(37)-N(1))-methyltransferase [Candidatus Kapabacteria bacterium]ROL56632.1 MAG: tRNA (guanosine(37)-N1)-methyltransferase TrmD [Bacteroidetes/Chlorobi group bacterium Naka2016]
MRIDIISAVPEIFDSFLHTSIIKNAQEKGVVQIFVHNLHKYSSDKFGHIDDTPYGGGSGMVIRCEPVFRCIEELKSQREYDEVIYLTADGEFYNQSIANELSLKRNLIFLCGHYKGVDQRIRDALVTREISIGDFILTGGELPAMLVIDSIVRLVPGVLGDPQAIFEDSFQDGLLEPPIYTKPADFRGMKVPDVLLSGNHKEIATWRYEQSLKKTAERRPDLLNQ